MPLQYMIKYNIVVHFQIFKIEKNSKFSKFSKIAQLKFYASISRYVPFPLMMLFE